MIISLAINVQALAMVAAFAALIGAAMPGPKSFTDAVRILLFRPALALIAGVGLYVTIATGAAIATAPRLAPEPPIKQARNNHRGEPIGDWGGRL